MFLNMLSGLEFRDIIAVVERQKKKSMGCEMETCTLRAPEPQYTSYSLNSLKGGYIGDYIGGLL